MCEPTTILAASTVLSAAGSIQGGLAQRNQANYAAAVARNNAVVAYGQAEDARKRGQKEELAHGRQLAQQKSAQIAAAAANGLDTGFGSPLDVVTDTSIYGALDAETIRENAAREATGYLVNAQNYKAESRAQKAAGKQAMISTAFDVGSTILNSAQQYRGIQTARKVG